MITFALEPWGDYVSDPATPLLWKEHHAELQPDAERMPMGVDHQYYAFMEAAGMLQIITARSEGKLVGYCLMVVKPHPRYRTVLTAFEDCYFLSKDFRGKGAGRELVAKSEFHAAKRGAKLCIFMCKASADHSKLFEAQGYKLSDFAFSKWIGD